MSNTIRKRILTVGLYSGALTGLLCICLLGLHFTVTLVISRDNLAVAYFLLPFLMIGIPIGVLVGVLQGFLVSLVVARFHVVEPLPISGLTLGILTSTLYPILLILKGEEPLAEVISALLGGVVWGGISGLFGGHMFVKLIRGNLQDGAA